MIDHQDAVAGGDAQHREESDQRTERDDAVAQVRGQHAADQAPRATARRRSSPGGQLSNEVCSRKKIAIAATIAEDKHLLLGRLPLGVLAEQLRMVLLREIDGLREHASTSA